MTPFFRCVRSGRKRWIGPTLRLIPRFVRALAAMLPKRVHEFTQQGASWGLVGLRAYHGLIFNMLSCLIWVALSSMQNMLVAFPVTPFYSVSPLIFFVTGTSTSQEPRQNANINIKIISTCYCQCQVQPEDTPPAMDTWHLSERQRCASDTRSQVDNILAALPQTASCSLHLTQ